jgi:hypothetical protein
MPTDIRNLPAFISDDATFRVWGSGLAAQIAAMGLVQTSDTGQINWATVTRPAIGALAGYEMWRFNDALQATKPVFIRLDYRISSGSVDRPALQPRVGTATDGAGTLTGQVGALFSPLLSGSSKSAGVVLPSFCSGSSSRLTLFTYVDLAGGNGTWGWMLWVERTKTDLGVTTGDGLVTWVASPNQVNFQAFPFAGAIPATYGRNPAISLASGLNQVSSVGPNVAFSPTIVSLGKPLFASWVAYMAADIPKLVPISIDHLGAVRTMMPLGDTAWVASVTDAPAVQGVVTGHSFAMLWE